MWNYTKEMMMKGLQQIQPQRDLMTLLELIATFVTGLTMWDLFIRFCVLLLSYYVLVTCKNLLVEGVKRVLLWVGKCLLRCIQSVFYRCCRVFRHNCAFCQMPVQKEAGHCMTCCHLIVHVSCMTHHTSGEHFHCVGCKQLTDRLLLQQVFSYVFNKASTYKIFDLAPPALSRSSIPITSTPVAEKTINTDFLNILQKKKE